MGYLSSQSPREHEFAMFSPGFLSDGYRRGVGGSRDSDRRIWHLGPRGAPMKGNELSIHAPQPDVPLICALMPAISGELESLHGMETCMGPGTFRGKGSKPLVGGETKV